MPATTTERVNGFFVRLSAIQVGAFALLGSLGVSGLDYVTGFEVSFSIFYLAPIALAAWYGGGHRMGVLLCILSACLWLSVDLVSGHAYTHAPIVFWNAGVRFGFFIFISLLISVLRRKLDSESRMARTDSLTGLANARAVRDSAESVFHLCRRLRLPVTVAFLDLDDFKVVNDTYGHAEGDRALVMVGSVLRGCLRKTDIVGRIGGDEFVFILPNTGEDAGRAVVRKVHEKLREAAGAHGWPLGFSLGVSLYGQAPPAEVEPIQVADELLYRAKGQGKDRVVFREEPSGILTEMRSRREETE